MITSEYVALRAAEVLALPLRLGQQILMVPQEGEAVYWESFEPNGKWFELAFHSQTLAILTASDEAKAKRLVEIVAEIRKQNPSFLSGAWWVRTDLEFDPAFGMGSSSTLLALLCDAAQVNSFPVLQNTFGGSGYDLACAFAHQPIVYRMGSDSPSYKEVSLSPKITDHLFFVYSGNKMVSSGEVKKFSSISLSAEQIDFFSRLTQELLNTTDHKTAAQLLERHEQKMADILEQPVLKTRFPDFDGCVKSMGAWGGDFFLAICDEVEMGKAYFREKGFSVLYTYNEIVLESEN